MISALVTLVAAGAPLELTTAGCEALDVIEVRRVLSVELRPVGHHADVRFVTRVSLGCDGQVVRVMVDDPVSRKSVARTVDLSNVAPTARERTLGLAAAELVTASWAELFTNPTPAVEPAAPAPPPEVRDEAVRAARERASVPARSRLLLEGTFALPLKAPLLWGLGLRWSFERFEVLGFELDVRVEHGDARFVQGTVAVNRAALGTGAHARVMLGRATLRALATLRGGVAELSGTPAPGSLVRGGSGAGPWLGLSLGGAASVQLGAVTLELGVEGGAPLAGVVGTVGGADAVRLDGPWFGAHLGAGVFP